MEGESKGWSEGKVVIISEVGKCTFWTAEERQQKACELLLDMTVLRTKLHYSRNSSTP